MNKTGFWLSVAAIIIPGGGIVAGLYFLSKTINRGERNVGRKVKRRKRTRSK